MTKRRRRTHEFLATFPNGIDGRVSVLDYGKDKAFATLEQRGYTNIEPYKPAPKCEFDKAAIIRMARSWGITWDIKITVRDAPKGDKNGSIYGQLIDGKPVHYITLSPQAANPERTTRHELGHALYNEQQYKRHGYDWLALAAASESEHTDYEYMNRPTEIFARSQETRDLHVRVTRSAH